LVAAVAAAEAAADASWGSPDDVALPACYVSSPYAAESVHAVSSAPPDPTAALHRTLPPVKINYLMMTN